MQHKFGLRAMLACCVLMAAAGDAGSDAGGTGTGAGAPPPADPPPPPPAVTPEAERKTRVRVLVDCPHGKANDVASLGTADLKAALEQGHVDDDSGAVAYAASLPQNQPKPAKAG